MTIAPMKALLRARGPLKAPLGTASCRSTGRSFILNNVSFRTIHLRSLTAGRIRAPDRTLLTTSSTTSSTKRTGRGYATEGASGPSGTRSSSTPGRSSIGKWSFRLCESAWCRAIPSAGQSLIFDWISVLLLAFPATYLIGSAFPPQLVLLLYPRYSPPPPDAKSTRGKSIMDGIERELQGLGFVDEMRLKVKNGEGWYETSQSMPAFLPPRWTSILHGNVTEQQLLQDHTPNLILKRCTTPSRRALYMVLED